MADAVDTALRSASEPWAGPDEDPGELPRGAAAEFRRRLEMGDYQELLDRRLSDVIAQAAQDRSLVREIGALRFVLARLLAEEDDPAKLAASVARVSSVLVQATRAQRAISGEVADGLTEAMTRILAELDD
ncbi:MAG TPA: hypothetical protein VGR16_00055 [Thermomicrobiales bacterium]|nr:hypothetical protein [Thermomicrobiales bacterium]